MSTVHIPADTIELDGELVLPPSAKGVVPVSYTHLTLPTIYSV